jgi:hypothetical protein
MQLSWNLHASTAATFATEKQKSFNAKEIFSHYNLPWIALCSVAVFVFGIIYNDNTISYNFLKAFAHAAALSIAYFASIQIMLRLFKLWDISISNSDLYKMVSYSFATIYSIGLITTFIPTLFFLKILNVYTVFIVWEASRVLFDSSEEQNSKVLFALSACVLFIAPIVRGIIGFALPLI